MCLYVDVDDLVQYEYFIPFYIIYLRLPRQSKKIAFQGAVI